MEKRQRVGGPAPRTSWCGPAPARPRAPPRSPGPPPPLPPASRSHFLLEPPAAAAAPSSPAAGRAPGEARRGPAGWGSRGREPGRSGTGHGRRPRKFACGRPRAGGSGLVASWAGAAGRAGRGPSHCEPAAAPGGWVPVPWAAVPARWSRGGPLRSEVSRPERKVSEVEGFRAGMWDSEVGCPQKLGSCSAVSGVGGLGWRWRSHWSGSCDICEVERGAVSGLSP